MQRRRLEKMYYSNGLVSRAVSANINNISSMPRCRHSSATDHRERTTHLYSVGGCFMPYDDRIEDCRRISLLFHCRVYITITQYVCASVGLRSRSIIDVSDTGKPSVNKNNGVFITYAEKKEKKKKRNSSGRRVAKKKKKSKQMRVPHTMRWAGIGVIFFRIFVHIHPHPVRISHAFAVNLLHCGHAYTRIFAHDKRFFPHGFFRGQKVSRVVDCVITFVRVLTRVKTVLDFQTNFRSCFHFGISDAVYLLRAAKRARLTDAVSRFRFYPIVVRTRKVCYIIKIS